MTRRFPQRLSIWNCHAVEKGNFLLQGWRPQVLLASVSWFRSQRGKSGIALAAGAFFHRHSEGTGVADGRGTLYAGCLVQIFRGHAFAAYLAVARAHQAFLGRRKRAPLPHIVECVKNAPSKPAARPTTNAQSDSIILPMTRKSSAITGWGWQLGRGARCKP